MKLIGLTGGIGSGKSTVAKILQARGWALVDADQIARDIVEPGQSALLELSRTFGRDILHADGTLDRAELARRAFVDARHTRLLNSITHPRIQQRTQELFDAARAAGATWCLYDMPLLVDKGLQAGMDEVIVVDVDVEERVRRLVEFRGFDPLDARRRIDQQVSDDVRLAAATFVVDNNGALEDLQPQVDAIAAAIEAS